MSEQNNTRNPEVAVLVGGCFWCLEAVFERLKSVRRVESGCMGGKVADPSYEQVCQGDTRHAEVVRLEFDSARIRYDEILGVFFSIHDSTTLNRQGNDVGTQYRSAIFYQDEAQKDCAESMIAKLGRQGVYGAPIVTEVVPGAEFYPAEAYHQGYFENNPYQPYCQFIVAPKVEKFSQQWKQRLK